MPLHGSIESHQRTELVEYVYFFTQREKVRQGKRQNENTPTKIEQDILKGLQVKCRPSFSQEPIQEEDGINELSSHRKNVFQFECTQLTL